MKPYEIKLQQKGLSFIMISASPEISRMGPVIKYWSENNGVLKCLTRIVQRIIFNCFGYEC